MKKISLVALSLFSFILLSSFITQEKKEKEEIDGFQLVENQSFRFEAESMTAQKGFHKSLMSNYYIVINGDSAKGYLPYVGRAYSGSYGGDGGIEFDNLMSNFSSELKEKKKEKNNQILLSFSVKGENETFECSISVSKSGFASVSVRSNNRQSCSYNGNIYPIEKEE